MRMLEIRKWTRFLLNIYTGNNLFIKLNCKFAAVCCSVSDILGESEMKSSRLKILKIFATCLYMINIINVYIENRIRQIDNGSLMARYRLLEPHPCCSNWRASTLVEFILSRYQEPFAPEDDGPNSSHPKFNASRVLFAILTPACLRPARYPFLKRKKATGRRRTLTRWLFSPSANLPKRFPFPNKYNFGSYPNLVVSSHLN